MDQIEEWVEDSKGKIRADKAQEIDLARLSGVGTVDPPGGRGGEGRLPAWLCSGAPAVGE
jgi:hypothetical protein